MWLSLRKKWGSWNQIRRNPAKGNPKASKRKARYFKKRARISRTPDYLPKISGGIYPKTIDITTVRAKGATVWVNRNLAKRLNIEFAGI